MSSLRAFKIEKSRPIEKNHHNALDGKKLKTSEQDR